MFSLIIDVYKRQALHYTSKHMSWLHCFWGVGTIISPYVMSYALTHSVWNSGYRIVSFIQIGIALILLLTLPVWKVNRRTEIAESSGEVLGLKGALKITGVPSLLTGFFAYCAAEATTMLWACLLYTSKMCIRDRSHAVLTVKSWRISQPGGAAIGAGRFRPQSPPPTPCRQT